MASFDNTDRIDAYLAGQMTDQEKAQFEQELHNAASASSLGTLQEETELQSDIILAIREQQLRKQLQEEEMMLRIQEQMAVGNAFVPDMDPLIRYQAYRKVGAGLLNTETSEPLCDIAPSDEPTSDKQPRKRARRWKIAGISVASIAVAAAICLCIVLVPAMRTMQQLSTQFAQSITIEPMRGTMLDPIETQLEQLYQCVASEQWSEAAPMARSLMEQTAQPLPTMSSEECREIYEQAQWLYTLSEMYQGHIFRAKRLLRQIADDGGLFAPQAKQYLDQL